MRIACVAFTENGLALARRLREGLAGQGDDVALSCSARLADALAGPDPGSGSGPELDSESGPDPSPNPNPGSGSNPSIRAVDDVRAWAAEAWATADALLFVGACGIAVRAVAPLVADKFSDPAVVCVDDAGTFAVPVLGGHVGGANRLARHVAGICGAQAVVTTATDVNHVFAVDDWAAERDLAILDREVAKEVSAALLRGERVGFANDAGVDAPEAAGIALGDAAASCTLGVSVSLDPERRPFARTLRLVPHTVVVGVGCRRGTEAQAILAQVDACLREAHVAPEAICAIASIDAKADEPGLLEAARIRGWELRFYDADKLAAVPGDFASSEFVRETVGVDNVCERAACAEGATLLVPKQAADGVTVAIAALETNGGTKGSTPFVPGTPFVSVVGIGPGGADGMTVRARAALAAAEVIVGYTTYVNLVRDDFPQAEFVSTGMRGEERRCRMALERAAAGQRVAVACSGDPGVYGMAGLLCELAPEYPGVRVEVVPGVSAANAGAALLGAPLVGDWCAISLSDLLTPWEHIEARLRAAAQAGFCIALYNPASHGRPDHLRRACDVLLGHLDPGTPCGIARNVGREGESSEVLTLAELRDASVDMLCCVFVGSARTRVIAGRLVTDRGYAREAAAGAKAKTKAQSPVDKTRSVLVFGGTTEGRLLVEALGARNTCRIVYCTATEYGASLVAGTRNVSSLVGPLSHERKRELVAGRDVACIVDATHPYAEHITSSINELAQDAGVDVVRIARADAPDDDGRWTCVACAGEAARHVASARGRVLLTTGTKDLDAFVEAMPDFRERLYVRILPVQASIDKAAGLGIPASHIVAMQGPFSARLNACLIRELGIEHMVTKRSGQAGGFDQKAAAAAECGIELVVIGRPAGGGDGVSLDEALRELEERYGL